MKLYNVKAKIESSSLQYLKIKNKETIRIILEIKFKDDNIKRIQFDFIQAENRLSKFILLLLKIANVKKWEKLVGKSILIGVVNHEMISLQNSKDKNLFIIFDEFFSGE